MGTINRVIIGQEDKVDASVEAEIRNQYEYHKWDAVKIDRGSRVRESLIIATMAIINNVPPCPDRSAALRKLREARMDCNSAITHDGMY